MKFIEMCEIVEKRIFNQYLYLKLKTDKIAGEARAGQFVNIRVSDSFDPLLRRPMSVHDKDGDCISILVMIKGKATKLLSVKMPGDSLNIIGPLGNSFPISDGKTLFVAGGIGIAPFLYLSKMLKPVALVLGVKNSERLPDLKPYMENMDIRIASDDGSVGVKGSAVDLARDAGLEGKTLYACGPNPMLKALSDEIIKYNINEAFYSIEAFMGCGFGACKGCAVETPGGDYKLTCVDGPVFRWDGIKL
jgi:dihydroorotate dehydrogenase electron transfer subunit